MASRTKIAKTATQGLKVLWEEGFFQSQKDRAAIEERFATKGNHFNGAELGMALLRAEHLTRRGKSGAYAW